MGGEMKNKMSLGEKDSNSRKDSGLRDVKSEAGHPHFSNLPSPSLCPPAEHPAQAREGEIKSHLSLRSPQSSRKIM